MEKQVEKKTLSLLTIHATFLMGSIDAYTFMEKNGVFASAQTGNMIGFSSKLFTGQFSQALGHVTVFIGFILGALMGEAIEEKVINNVYKKYRVHLSIQSGILCLSALFQQQLTDSIMVFLLGILSGYELTIFRKIGHTTVNNGVVTGNIKTWITSFYRFVFTKEREAQMIFKDLSIGIVTFILGVGLGSLVNIAAVTLNLWVAFVMSVLVLCWLLVKNSDE